MGTLVYENVERMSEVIQLPAGDYSRQELLALAMGVARVPSDADDSVPQAPPEPRASDVFDVVTSVRLHRPWMHTQAPKGQPGISHVLDVMNWLAGDKARRKKVMDVLFTDQEHTVLAKNTTQLAAVIGHLPVYDSARWIFQATVGFISPAAVWQALAGDPMPLAEQLFAWGLTPTGMAKPSVAWSAAQAHSFMADIVDGRRQDGQENAEPAPVSARVAGDAQGLLAALYTAAEAMPEAVRAKMEDHIVRGYDADPERAMAPLGKVMGQRGLSVEFQQTCELLRAGAVPVAVLAGAFLGHWDRLRPLVLGHVVRS